MTSKIDPNTIDPNFPSANQDNPSQGFRDNFSAIRANFEQANLELTNLQDKVITVTGPVVTTVPFNIGANASPATMQVDFKFSDANYQLTFPGTSAVVIPKGTTAQRPNPLKGQIRYNTDINDMEVYVQGTWKQLRYKEATTIVQQNLGTGNYSQTQFGPLSQVPAAGQNILVFVENVFQIYQTNYTIHFR